MPRPIEAPVTAVAVHDAGVPEWLAFVSQHGDATPFHHPAWVQTLAHCYGYRPFTVVATDEHGSVRAGLTLMEVSSLLTGKRWVALPFTDYFTALYDAAEDFAAITRWLVDGYHDGAMPPVEVHSELAAVGVAADHVSPGARYIVHRIPLSRDRDELARRIDRRHRQNAQAARKHGVVIERGASIEHMRAYYQLHVQTRHRQGVPVQPWSFFRTLAGTMLEPGLGSVLLAHKDGQHVAGLVCLHWNGFCIAKYAASKADARQFRPNDLLFDTAIGWAGESGCHTFDFGRTDVDNAGLRRYKKGWGAIETEVCYSVVSRRPPRSGALVRRGRSATRRVLKASPTWVCQASGRVLYRHFG